MVMNCCSGIELLGSLISSDGFDKHKGAEYFRLYWVTYLYPNMPDISTEFYKLVRHGLAHAFVTKPWINVTKRQQGMHLRFKDDVFYVDSTALANDLRQSYSRFVGSFDRTNAERQLNDRLKVWGDDRKHVQSIRERLAENWPIVLDLPLALTNSAWADPPAPSGMSPDWGKQTSVNSPSVQIVGYSSGRQPADPDDEE
jgi:hypothetical protein